MLKAAILFLLLAMVVSLFSGLFFLVRDEGRTSRVAWALTLRVVLATLIVALMLWGFSRGRLAAALP